MNPPLYEPDEQATYTLDVVSRITGISSQTILHYQETGLLRSSDFDDEAVRTLRRIEHLQSTLEVNDAGLKLIMDLMDEVDQLRADLRSRHRGHAKTAARTNRTAV